MKPTSEMLKAGMNAQKAHRAGDAFEGEVRDILTAALALLPGEPIGYADLDHIARKEDAGSSIYPKPTGGCRAPVYAAPLIPHGQMSVIEAVDAWLSQPEGYGLRIERLYDEINYSPKVRPWLEAAYQRGFEASAASPAPLPVAVKIKPLEWKHDGHSYYAYCGVTDVRWTAGNTEEMAQKDEIRATRIRSALSSPASPQCCMCGKKGLSTVEGDGGSECELSDGRWVCSAECWDKAVDPTPASDIAALREENAGTSNIIAAFERDYPELYWHIAKGKVCAGEPLYGAIITLQGGDEIGHGESELSAEDAFRIAFVNSGLPTPPSYRTPSKAEIISAVDTIYRANGADLDQWTAGVLPSDDVKEARSALQHVAKGER